MRGEQPARGFNANAACFDPKRLRPERERLAERPGGSPAAFSLPADLFGEFAEEEKTRGVEGEDEAVAAGGKKRR